MLTLTLSNKDALQALFAALIPALVSWLKSTNWSHQAKVALAVVVSGIAGAIVVAVDGQIDLTNWLQTAAIILAASQAFYALYFKWTTINALLEKQPGLGGRP